MACKWNLYCLFFPSVMDSHLSFPAYFPDRLIDSQIRRIPRPLYIHHRPPHRQPLHARACLVPPHHQHHLPRLRRVLPQPDLHHRLVRREPDLPKHPQDAARAGNHSAGRLQRDRSSPRQHPRHAAHVSDRLRRAVRGSNGQLDRRHRLRPDLRARTRSCDSAMHSVRYAGLHRPGVPHHLGH